MDAASRFSRLIVVLMLLAGLLAACGGSPSTPSGGGGASGESIKIGGIFDLTGATADVGTPYQEGVAAYVDWINSKGGINGRPIQLISNDYAYKVENAQTLYSQYVNQDKVVAIQGWGTGDTEALKTKIAQDKIPFMSASYSENLINPAETPYNFLIGVTYSDQMRIAINYIAQQVGDKQPQVAFMYNDSPFGQSPLPAGRELIQANGWPAPIEVAMPRGATDLTPQLQQVQNADYIIIQNTSGPAALAVKGAKQLGMKAQFINLNWGTDENFIKLAGDAAEGVLGTSPFAFPGDNVEGLKPIREYTQQKGINLDEKGLHFVQGWITMDVMAEGIKRALEKGGTLTGEQIKAALETLNNYDTGGITAPITFSDKSHAGATQLKIYQVKGGKWVAITDLISAGTAE